MNLFTNIYKKLDEFNNFSIADEYYLNFLCTIVLLFPLFLLTGPFLPDLTIVICSLSFIYFILKYNLSNYLENLFFKIFIVFWIYIVFVSLISDNILFSLKSSFFYIRFIFFSLFVFFLLNNFKFFPKFFFHLLTITLLIVLIDSYFQFYFGKSLTGFDKPKLRLTGPFDDRQIVGSFIFRILPLYLSLYLYIFKKINLKILIFIALLSILVLFSGERTAFFLLTFFIFGVYFLINKKLLKLITILISYCLISILIILNTPSLKERMLDQTFQAFGIKKYQKTDGEDNYFKDKPKRGFYIFSRAHEVHYLTAYKMFKENPITGLGPNLFRKKCSDEKFFIEQSSCTTHPHNFLLQLLAEMGSIGALFYLFILFLLLKQILSLIYETKIKKINLINSKLNIYILNLGFIVNSFMFFLPNGNFFNNYLNAMIFIPVGFYLFQNGNDK
jgi:hypothetical protein